MVMAGGGGLQMVEGILRTLGTVHGLPVDLPRLGSNTARYFCRAPNTYQCFWSK